MEQCDIAIVGAGMVGAATACLLAAQGLSVRVIETQLPEHYAPEQPLDLRVSAISQASVALLEQAGAWHHLQQMRLCPYRRLETWELDGFATRFNSADLGLPQLGYIIENRLVQLALLKRMEDFPTIQTHTPAAVMSLRQSADEAVLTLDDGTELAARWVLACDGAESHTRKLAGIGVSRFEYRQHCMLINIDTDFAQEDITWQQFTPSGPRAFLPLPGQHGSLVWYDSPARIRALTAMSNEGLAAEVRRHFPSRLGGFTVTGKGASRWCAATPTTITPLGWCCLAMLPTPSTRWRGRGSTLASRMWPAGSTCCKVLALTGINLCWPSATSGAVVPTTC